jgi:hypothetical protein
MTRSWRGCGLAVAGLWQGVLHSKQGEWNRLQNTHPPGGIYVSSQHYNSLTSARRQSKTHAKDARTLASTKHVEVLEKAQSSASYEHDPTQKSDGSPCSIT